MNISPNVKLERIDEADLKLQFQITKCLNDKRCRESTQDYLEELAGYISGASFDMCSLSANPEKCAIIQEAVNHLSQCKIGSPSGDDLQKSEVSSSKPCYLGSDLIAPFLLNALDGFMFMVNTDGKIEFITQNVESFINYRHESLTDNSIYNIIHVGDHARFSSNLLPMSIGNGFGWCEPNTKNSSFQCRFLVKPPEDQEETMEEKQTRISQYENMHISAVLLPNKGSPQDNTGEAQGEVQNRLVCIARRLPSGEKNSASGSEQFLTRLDPRGKIISVDTTNISAAYTKYLNKDLVGCVLQEICHPEDFQKLTQHLKETLQQGSNTSGIYRLRLAHEKIIRVQTRSKRSNYNPMASDQEVIVASHTIILDSDSVSAPSSNPSLANMNGGYSFSPQDFNLNDLDFLPTSSWDHLGGSANDDASRATDSPARQVGSPFPNSFPFSPQTSVSRTSSPAPNNKTVVSTNGGGVASPMSALTGSDSMSGLMSGLNVKREEAGNGGDRQQMASPGPTGEEPGSERTASPMSGLMSGLVKREEDQMMGLMGGEGRPLVSPGADASATRKLRSLLTHGVEEADSSAKNGKAEEVNGFGSDPAHDENNIILRELLNQEDEEMGDGDVGKGLSLDTNCNMSVEMCGGDAFQKRTLNNNNNMLRKLLNNDEDKSFKRNQDQLIQQLLKTEGKVSGDLNSLQPAVSKPGGPSRMPNSVMDVTMNNVAKRKSPDTPMEESMAKRPHQNQPHAHLAGQNPMLASMLAQTPRTAPTVPTSIANAIVSQLPQERLPKNLEKKLVHTPYTGAPPTGGTGSSSGQYSFAPGHVGGARSLLSTSLQQEVVTADSRGHVTLAPQQQNSFNQVTHYMSRMLSSGESNQSIQLGNYGNLVPSSQQQASIQNTANLLIDGLAEASRDPNNVVSASDPLLSDILDQVWSMEQDMNMATDDFAFFKLLEELPETGQAAPPVASSPPSAQDAQEKLAIQSIQKQLMSFEVQPGRNNPRFQPPSSSYSAPVGGSSQPFQSGAPPAYTNPQRGRTPPNITPQQMNRQGGGLPQYGGAGTNFNDLTPPMRRQLLEQHKQKVFFQQFNQKKQLLLQQKQQQLALNTMNNRLPENIPNLQSPASSPFGDNINDLINNSVAPNVTLQRSASMPEPQLSPRYSQQQGPPASPSQLSPRGGPFSPLSQQQGGYPPPNNYPPPPSRLSPHVQSQGGPQTQAWVRQQSQANLQQQNPMLNAQLSQQQFASQQQARFNSQQQPRQPLLHSLPSPQGGNRNSPYSNPPDSPFHPPSPGAPLYQPQQRMQQQRAVAIPNRVNSPRGLPAGFPDPLLSPQPSPGNYNSPASNFNNSNYNQLDNFNSYEQQVYQQQPIMDRSRGNGSGAIRSEYVRQELRAKVGARTQQHQMHQQLVQQMPTATGSQSTNQSISQADFDALGFALDMGNDGQPTSPALYPQSLLNSVGGPNSNDGQQRTGSPRFQLEERPAEQKKSLLQQLLSEPP